MTVLSAPPPPAERTDLGTVRGQIIRGSGWMVLMRWSMRLIGLVSTLVLVRMLAPADFGLMAMALVLVGLLEVLAAANFDLALIGTASPTRAHYDTAWTFQAINGLLLAGVLVLAAPLAAAYFGEPRLVPLVAVLAIRTAIGGFVNIGIVDFRRGMDFAREFRFHTSVKVVMSTTTIVLAFALADYRALVAGLLMGALTEVVLSYAMHPYRPRPSIARAREIWSFSRWMVVFNGGNFAKAKLDEIVVGGFGGAGSLGTYHVAADLATLPTSEVVMPLSRALFPGYARLAGDGRKLADGFTEMLALLAALCLGLGVGLAVVADDVVLTILGARWQAAAPLMEWLAVFGALSGLAHGAGMFLIASGAARTTATLVWAQVALLAAALVLAGPGIGLVGIAAIRTLVAGALLIATLVFVVRLSQVSTRDVVGALWRPVLASLVMAAVVKMCPLARLELPLVGLILHAALGGGAFALATFALWWLAGRPDGVERLVAARIARGRVAVKPEPVTE